MSSRGRCPMASMVEINSGGSRPSDNGEPSHPHPEKKKGGGGGGLKKIFFQPFGPQFGLKIRGWGVGGGGGGGGGQAPWAPPLDLPLIKVVESW